MDEPPAKHRFWVETSAVDGERVTLNAAQSHQVSAVLRLRPGQRIRVFHEAYDADLVVALDEVRPDRAMGRVVGTTPHAPEPLVQLVAYPSLLPRDKFEQVLQKLVEVGIGAVVPVLSERCLVREGPDVARLDRWRAIMREAAEQSGRGCVPSLEPAVPFQEAIARATGAGCALLAYEGERECRLRDVLDDVDVSGDAPVGLFVGPEGGYAREEVQAAQAAGARVVSLGPRTLRTETASPILAALVLYHVEG